RTTERCSKVCAQGDQIIRLTGELVHRHTQVLQLGTDNGSHLAILVCRQAEIRGGTVRPLLDLPRAGLEHRVYSAETLLGLGRNTDQLFTEQTGDTDNSRGPGDQPVLPLREIAAGLLKLTVQPIGLSADSPQSSLGVAGIPGNGQRNRWPGHYINPLS